MADSSATLMESMRFLMNPRAIAVVGASQQRGRGTNLLVNLRDTGFAGEIYAVNPRYTEVLGYRCFPSVAALPDGVDCLLVATGANAACDVLEEGFARGIRAAVVLAAGFGEGGHGEGRADRLRALAAQGMCICGPNCYGALNVKGNVAAYSGHIPTPLRPGPIALVSQSGGLGNNAFTPLMRDRELGFAYVISCGNQLGATIEDYVEYFVNDPDVTVIAAVVESLKNPQKLLRVAQAANARRKALVFLQSGRSAAGRVMVRSHTGALAGDAEIMAAFLRRCGIVQAQSYDEFVETIELFAVAPRDPEVGRELVIISGSGGGAAIACDALEAAGMPLSELHPATKAQIESALPEFGSVNNPLDGTGALYDDATLLPKLFDAILADPGRPIVAGAVSAVSLAGGQMTRFAQIFADASAASGRTVIAYTPSPLGGPLNADLVRALHGGKVPLLLGIASAMSAIRHLGTRRDFWARTDAAQPIPRAPTGTPAAFGDFMAARRALHDHGVAIVDAALAGSAAEAAGLQKRFGRPVAIKAEAPGLLHKSDAGCVRLNCADEGAARAAYEAVTANATKAGFPTTQALVQPMSAGMAEAYAGIIDDPLFGPAICFGLGGIFIEILHDTVTEMAPLSRETTLGMIRRIKAAKILQGARGQPAGDIEALANLLVRLGDFAVAHAGQFRALDLNPIIVKPAGEGVFAVDIAVEPIG